jgi:hypothetical protein
MTFRVFFTVCVCVQVKFSMLEIYNELAPDDFLSFFYSVCVFR